MSGGDGWLLPRPPRVGRQRRQAVQGPCALAFRAVLAVLAMEWKLPAGAGTLLVDGAAYRIAHLPHQCHAARLRLVGTPHAAEVRSDLLYQTDRHGAAGSRGGRAAGEGDAEGSAAGAGVKGGGCVAHRMAFLDSLRWSEFFRLSGGIPQGGDANFSCEDHPLPAAG